MKLVDNMRRRAGIVTVALLWINFALAVFRVIWGAEGSSIFLIGGGLALSLVGTLTWKLDPIGATTRAMSGVVHAAMVSLIVYSFSGSPLQIDIHLYFFAVLAICTAWIDWRPIVTFTAFTAVHHLVLSFVVPAMVFPGEAHFAQVPIHAVILLLEAGILLTIVQALLKAFQETHNAMEEAARSQAQTVQSHAEGEKARISNDALRAERDATAAASLIALEAFVAEIEFGFAQLSEGNLTVRLKQPSSPQYERIQVLFNVSVGNLETAIGSVVEAVGTIRSGLNEISVASNDLAQRTEQQAASLEETVAALSEVTSAVNETAGSAGQAQASASMAQKTAVRSVEVVGRAVAAMAGIENSSKQIGNIVGVIDEIAFQTNLLALNAGVEAARAGEAGLGFAVVAQEVRGLAQRSAEAAKEIKNLIATSSAQVQQGVELVTASGKSLEEIVGQVAVMSGVVSDIATSAREQAVNLREVSTAADQMDKVTQQNAAMVEETTAAAQNLSSETEVLAAMVARFKTKAGVSANPATFRPASKSRPEVASRAIPQMRNQGNGGTAARQASDADTWAEF